METPGQSRSRMGESATIQMSTLPGGVGVGEGLCSITFFLSSGMLILFWFILPIKEHVKLGTV